MKYNDTTYHPIPGAEYSRYELAILHHEHLRLCWQEPDKLLHLMALTPDDLLSKDRAEFLFAHNIAGHNYKIRLDYIRHFEII